MKIHQIIFNSTGETQRVSEILLFLLLTFFLAYIQTTDAKGQSPCFSYGASIMNGDLYCGHQEDSVFAMHSVMKFPQALYVADYLHKKGLTLSDSVLVHKDSLDAETWSPMLSIFEGMRYFTFAELIEWSLKQSDNNACDLLFASCGQPDAVEKYIHTLGFKDIHVQLTEKEMKKILIKPQKTQPLQKKWQGSWSGFIFIGMTTRISPLSGIQWLIVIRVSNA